MRARAVEIRHLAAPLLQHERLERQRHDGTRGTRTGGQMPAHVGRQHTVLDQISAVELLAVRGEERVVPGSDGRRESLLYPAHDPRRDHSLEGLFQPVLRRSPMIRLRLAQSDHQFHQPIVDQRQTEFDRRRHAQAIPLRHPVLEQVGLADQRGQADVRAFPRERPGVQIVRSRSAQLHLKAGRIEEGCRLRHGQAEIRSELVEDQPLVAGVLVAPEAFHARPHAEGVARPVKERPRPEVPRPLGPGDVR